MKRFKSNWKIKLHFDWIKKYLKGQSYPICLEIDPSNKCPLNCEHCCWGKYRSDNPKMIKAETLGALVAEAQSLGVKSIIWTGGGEPLTNPATLEAVRNAKILGLDNGMFTNAVLMNRKASKILVKNLNWIRFHVAGSTPEYYTEAHRVPENTFIRVCQNIKDFQYLNKGKVSAGIGVAINKKNFEGTKGLPKLAAKLGLNYFQGKLDFNQVHDDKYVEWWTEKVIPYFDSLVSPAEGFKTHIFSDPVVRECSVKYCHAHQIITAITADGRVAFCKMRRDQKQFSLGNIYKNTLKEIFDGTVHEVIAKSIQPKTCSILKSFCPYRTTNEVVDELVQLDQSLKPKHRNFF